MFKASGTYCYFWLSLGPLVIECSLFSELDFKNLQRQTHLWLQSCIHIGVAESFIHSTNICSRLTTRPVLWTVISHAGLVLSLGRPLLWFFRGWKTSCSLNCLPLQIRFSSSGTLMLFVPSRILFLPILRPFMHFQSLGSLDPSPLPTGRLFNIQNSDSNDTPNPSSKHNKREEETLVIRPLFSASLPPQTHLADLILLTCSYLLTPGTFVTLSFDILSHQATESAQWLLKVNFDG